MLTSAPFLLFDGDCAEAMTFYRDCFGGELSIMRLGDTPMREQFPPETHDRTINAELVNGTFSITASDWMASPEFDPVLGNTFAVYVTGEAGDDLAGPFDRLKAGGGITHLQDLHEMPFGLYGQLFDRYGTQWIFRGAQAA